ncbi:patatin-like phospholipase family protein [Capilliphycus salinus ALCB114379]|uniref:patatin-like phospholipase family protein n=1 Tax=Capilliphycus salinus TaxID=2768948 RepID=UPI0039A42C56
MVQVGLVLGSGGARGWAHIGVIRALEEAEIKVDYLSGASIGAFVGAIYGVESLGKLEDFANEIDVNYLLSLLDISFPNMGLIDGERVVNFIRKFISDKKFEETTIPFRCVATNFLLKKEIVFDSGSLIDAVRASISIPGIFRPFKREEVYLVDGGIVNPVPVSVVKDMGAEVIIAVNLNSDSEAEEADSDGYPYISQSDISSEKIDEESQERQEKEQQESGIVQNLTGRYDTLKRILPNQIDDWIPDAKTGLNIFDVIGNSINVMEQQVTQIQLQINQPDLLIEPNLMDFGIFDFHQAKPIMQKGYDAAKAKIPQIKEVLETSA